MKDMFVDDDEKMRYVYCPLCDEYYLTSEYLHTVFEKEPKAEFLANLVTHYRHNHINYYDNSVGYVCRFHDYDTFKRIVNNCAKRQIIRKAKDYLINVGITVEDFCRLQSTDENTVALACRMLSTTKADGVNCGEK